MCWRALPAGQFWVNANTKDISDLSFGVHFHGSVAKPVYSSETIIPPDVKFHVTDVDGNGNLILKEL